ncbi:MAG TPA: hypothetical protein VGP36_11635 [Mycobacteriales bacterium]|nr:hypothetical protein [Mycobacteriales bacterium]
MQFLEGGATGPNGRDSRTVRSSEQDPAGEAPDDTGGRGSLMSRYRGAGPAPAEDQVTPPLPRTGEQGGAPGAPTDSPWRESNWTSAPPVPPVAPPAASAPAPAVPSPAPVPAVPGASPAFGSAPATSGAPGAPARPADKPAEPTAKPAEPTAKPAEPAARPGDATGRAAGAPVTEARAAEARIAEARVGGAPVTEAPVIKAPTTETVTPAPEAEIPAEKPAPKAETPAVTATRGTTPGSTPARTGMLAAEHTGAFKDRWRDLQADFVDDPQQAVRGAGELARDVLAALSDKIADSERVESWQAEDGTSGTEDLRVALRQYRTLVDRLLEL